MSNIVLIKIGGGLITDKATPFSVRDDMMKTAADGIRRAKVKYPQLSFVVANGAGSFGHYLASKSAETDSPSAHQLRVRGIHESVARLNNIFTRHLLDAGISAFSMSPSSFISATDGVVSSVAGESVAALLDNSFVPV